MGTPPISSAADRGMSLAGAGKRRAYFSRMCKSIASSVNPALRFLWWEQNPARCSRHYLNLSHFLGYESKVRHCCDWPILANLLLFSMCIWILLAARSTFHTVLSLE